MPQRHSRRRLLGKLAAAPAGLPMLLPGLSRAASPNEKVNIAGVGVDGKGWSDINSVSRRQNVVAICDVDEKRMARAAKRFPEARVYTDWRKLLEQKNIDAVTVSTPDHMHAPIAMSAMQLGKHVYVQKPMTHSVFEARQLRLAAKEFGVVTQMGNQHHSGTGYRTLVKLIRDGAIGKVTEAHAWSNRPSWPQGMKSRPKGRGDVPANLHWDNWLGVAPARDYVEKVYHPFRWRGWVDFGTGALGDMACHIMDPVFWALELTAPLRIWSDGPAPNAESYPNQSVIHYEFPATKRTAGQTLRVTWHDGGNLPKRELVPLPEGVKTPDNGSLYIGERGVLLCRHIGTPQLLPAEKFADYPIEPVKADNHYMQWTNAIRGETETSSHFDYAGPLTETVLLGNLALRFPGRKLEWNAADLKVTNVAEANRYVRREYRKGWQVKQLA